MDSESATPAEKASPLQSPSKSASETPAPPPPAAAALSDTSDSESDDEAPQVEWLATARERRSTAGNRMKSMLAAEEPDDDLELLFAEDDNDQGFSDGGADGSDVHMDSSSDDEDNNAAGADDLEGEKELEKKEKEKKRAAQRKRKAQDAHIPAKFRKKVRINTDAPPPRPKKKSERASWLPSVADAPTRASARSTTRMSKEQLHTQMVEREERRLKQVAQMEKKAAKLAASRKPPMTQEERLIEAEKVEQRNKGSLNRWEEAEKAREEDRLRKLKALTERSLEGPVISFWSGVREGQVRYVEMEEKPVRKKREKPAKGKTGETKDGEDGATPKPDANTGAEKPVDETADTDKGTPAATNGTKPEIASTEGGDTAPEKPGSKPPEPANGRADSIKASEGEDSKNVSTAASPVPTAEATDSPAEATTTALAEDKDSTAEKPAVDPPLPQEGSKDTKEQPADAAAAATPASEPSNEQLVETAAPSNPETKSASAPVVPDLTTSATTASADIPPSAVVPAPDTVNTSTSQPQPSDQPSKDSFIPPPIDISTKETATSAPQSEVPTPKPEQADETSSTGVTERAPRNAIIFQNFNENVIKDKSIQTQILFGQKMAKLAKPTPNPVCVITNRPARYRDPSTGLPFATAHAYNEIRRLIRGDYKWSRLLGAWVGTGTYAARGVPERFLNPNAPSTKKKQEDEAKKDAAAEESKPADGTTKVEAGGAADVTMAEAPAVAAS